MLTAMGLPPLLGLAILLLSNLLPAFVGALESPDSVQVPVNIWPANGSWITSREIFEPQDGLSYHSGVIENGSKILQQPLVGC